MFVFSNDWQTVFRHASCSFTEIRLIKLYFFYDRVEPYILFECALFGFGVLFTSERR